MAKHLVDVNAAHASNGLSRTVAYKKLQYVLVDTNVSPKLFKILEAEGIYQPDEGALQTPGGLI